MSKRLVVLVFIAVSLHGINTTAQTETNRPLTIVLETLQERFGVQFNYASKLVEGVTVVTPSTSFNLQESLDYLTDRTNLDFVIVSDNIISIKAKKILLCGYLKDKDSGEALPYVTVGNGSIGTIANEEGYFELDGLSPNDVISIKHLGFKPLQREVRYFSTEECNAIYLIPYQEKLAEVVVYDFLVRGIDKLDNGTVRLDFDRFSILPGLIEDDVLQSVQALPGIMSIDETVSNINIRGGSHDQNLITWDGIKMYQSGHFFGLISMYNPEITQKVELRKNGSKAAETDGVSGTIAMKTEAYLNSNLRGSIGANLIDANGSIDVPLGQRASIQIAARKSISDFVETPTYSNYFDRVSQDTEIERNEETVTNTGIAFDFYDTSFRLLYHPTEKDRLRINFIHTANEVIFDENAELNGEPERRESSLDQSSIAAGIFYKRNWSEKLNTELSAYNTDYELRAINANILNNQRFLQENAVSETGIKLKLQKRMSPRINLTNGYHFVETKVTNLDDIDDPLFRRLEGEVLRTYSIFNEVGFSSKNAKTHANIGLRFNYLDEFNKQLWEPRLSFNQQLSQYFTVEVLGEFKHQSTSQIINFQNDFLGLEKRRWQLSNNESIPVIRGKQASLGVNFNKDGWLINAVSFLKRVNGITSQSQGFQGPYEFSRTLGSYDAIGLDLLLRKQFSENSLWMSYSYLNSDYFFGELQETSFPNNFDISHGLTVGTDYTIGQLLFAFGLNWRTGRPFTMPIAEDEVVDGEINYGTVNENQLKDYLRLDFSTNYHFKWSKNTKAQIGLSVWNVLDRNNSINTFYRIGSSQTEIAQRLNQRSLGITPNISMKVYLN